ncbi:unnamed protein product [Symbiodinium microadriaticum]|nr:unnamed protein product [Symbiodinium microadriaticum]
MDATFVIGFHTQRFDNLLQTLRFLQKNHSDFIKHCQLVTVCQDEVSRENVSEARLDTVTMVDDEDKGMAVGEFNYWSRYFGRWDHFDLKVDCMQLPILTNFGVGKAVSDKIFLLESDRILPAKYFEYVHSVIEEGYQFTTKDMLKLLAPATDGEIENKNFRSKNENRSRVAEIGMRSMWSGNTAFMKKDFYRAGKMDEAYKGYGWADNDMTLTMETAGVESIFSEEFVELHLWHPPATYDGTKDSKLLFVENGATSDMNETVYYHWFGCTADAPPYANLRAPIIVSIATLRAVSDIPIVVMDISGIENDWGHFPEKLNFRVTTPQPKLASYKGYKGWQHLSRLFDLDRYAQDNTIIYSDADVFWLKDPRPLAGLQSRFCFDGYNTGFFYYDITMMDKFHEVFQAYTLAALNSTEVREVLKKHVGYEPWHYVWDEMIMTYIREENPELVDIIPNEEHGQPRRFDSTNLEEMKNLHLNGVYIRNPLPKNPLEKEHCRGLAGIVFSEFYERLQESLGDDIHKVFTKSELQLGLKHQFSLLNETHRLLDTKRPDGHYELCQDNIMMV